jgi:membrane protein DedA with SNARE-associated domain
MREQLLSPIVDYGLLAIVALMAVDAVIPAGGELVMLIGGALSAGAITGGPGPSLASVIAAGTLGYLLGSIAGWAIGRAGGRALVERHGRWLHLGPDRLARAERWFHRYGSAFVLLGRLVPLVRSFVSIPAGVLAFPFGAYVLLSGAASLVWCLGFGLAGHALGTNWESVHSAFRYADYAVVAVALAAMVAFVATRRRRQRPASPSSSGSR